MRTHIGNLIILTCFILCCSCATQRSKKAGDFTTFSSNDFNWKELTGKAVYVSSRGSAPASVKEEVYTIPAIQQLEEARALMPESLGELTQHFMNQLLEQYPDLTEHQKEMLHNDAKCGMRVLSKKTDPKYFSFVHHKLQKAFLYLRDTKGIQSGYAFVGNISKKNVGGQKGYIINMANGELVEIDISSAWKGVGYENDSGQTPLGYFLVYKDYHQKGWQSKTITTDPKHIFYKLHRQAYDGEAMYIFRKSTKIEKAFICSNQFGLIGQNFGSEYIDLSAPQYLQKSPEDVCYIDNSNSGKRQLYIHGSNRVDQLGFALSGGCVRVSNINSFIIKEIVAKQGTMPVFLDAVAFHEPRPVKVPGFDDSDLESIYNSQSIVLRKQNLLDSVSLLKNLYANVLPELANSLAYRMSKVEKQHANVDIYVTVPFPESAMKYWLTLHQSDEYANITFQQHFGFRGEYFKNVNRTTQNPFFKAYHSQEINDYFSNRISDTKSALHADLSKALVKYELDTVLLSSVEINDQTLTDDHFNVLTDSLEPLEYFSISNERKRVLHYMEMIDSLTQSNPEVFSNWEHLQWVKKYIPFRGNSQMVAESNGIDYNDVVLMQAYIYALGEEELYRKGVKAGELVSVKGQYFQDKLSNRHGVAEAMKMMDETGLWVLFQYSHSSENRTLMKMVSVAYPKEDMLYGMQMLAEAYYSKYKWKANQYVISSEVDGETISLAD
ncbi:L,D-transpeptidase [Flammeovirga sp. EKP202]|uniref:L,D-transpeptidase n=1 Tax=Flammeovirga sp. EKP202 TaxID=2770592 RepID=UPI00165F4AAE|nr:L,D-transpeptidase family protein [Flammeovirga sp. EKP202]MBD0400143.1 L,D-transpeptidase family protein [Flammeovirga sp. EKP202]